MNPLKKKAPARTSGGKQKRKSREELNVEGRARKRQKKHRGNPAGSRHQERSSDKHQSSKKQPDPRLGSKVSVPLIVGEQTTKPAAAKPQTETKPRISPQEELAMLENDDRLDALLERLENGEKLSEEENAYVDTTLDRIDALMEELGIKLDEEESEEEKQDDIMQLLKGN
ncbi:Der GTPase-activating protein YihI [Photorhabdus asymbiotica]|uniref:Der GTPase-activating protein YihI n=1 Tax=Photorhabdus asymbiotica TaxID=291112 RepID=UPI003DA72174